MKQTKKCVYTSIYNEKKKKMERRIEQRLLNKNVITWQPCRSSTVRTPFHLQHTRIAIIVDRRNRTKKKKQESTEPASNITKNHSQTHTHVKPYCIREWGMSSPLSIIFVFFFSSLYLMPCAFTSYGCIFCCCSYSFNIYARTRVIRNVFCMWILWMCVARLSYRCEFI